MKFLKIAVSLIFIPLLLGLVSHKYYVGITKIEYISESKSLQIISQVFVEDLELALSSRYNVDISLGTDKERLEDKELIKEYILNKLTIEVNGSPVILNYIGMEYNSDMVKCYIEVTNVSEIKSLEIENKVLMDQFSEQQNIVHFKSEKNRRSIILYKDNPKGVLNFD